MRVMFSIKVIYSNEYEEIETLDLEENKLDSRPFQLSISMPVIGVNSGRCRSVLLTVD